MARPRHAEANLDTYRREIADIDRRLVLLLARRWATVRTTMGFKRSRHLALFDAAQEERVLARARGWAQELNLSAAAVDRLFRSIVEEGRRLAGLPGETPTSGRTRAGARRRSAVRPSRSASAAKKPARTAER